MRAKDFLTEMGDNPYPYTITNTDSYYPHYHFRGKPPPGSDKESQEYLVIFYPESRMPTHVAISFITYDKYNVDTDTDGSQLTGIYDRRVVSTVAAIVSDYLRKQDLDEICFFTSGSQRRRKFYDKIMPKIQRLIKGYESNISKDDNRWASYKDYCLIKSGSKQEKRA